MSFEHQFDFAHRLPTGVAQLRAAAAELSEAAMFSMNDREVSEALHGICALEHQLGALKSRVLRHAESSGTAVRDNTVRHTRTASWYAGLTRTSRPGAHRDARLALALAAHRLVESAMDRGEVSAEQARVICRGVDDLPEGTAPELVARAEEHLIGLCATFDAQALVRLTRRVLEVVDPAHADEHEARLLAAEESDAEARTTFVMGADGTGVTRGRFTLPDAVAAQLRRTLQGLASPKHVRATEGAGAYSYDKPSDQRMGHSFAELINRLPAEVVPTAGGVNAQVIVHLSEDTMRGEPVAAELDSGERLSPELALQWLCEAIVTPVVKDHAGSVLDLGRTRRLFSPRQRLAKQATQRTCQARGCDFPAALCHAHHRTPWAEGGRSDLAELILLCPKHHHEAHRRPDHYRWLDDKPDPPLTMIGARPERPPDG